MGYKAFEDFYREAEIKHLVLHQHGDYLVSPPFCTDKCKDYNGFMFYRDGIFEFLELDLPAATSKFNGICSIGDSIWTIPYGIFDNFHTILQIKDRTPIYHTIDKPGKGQFYSLASDNAQAFSFPLGYEDTAFAIHIKGNEIVLHDFDTHGHRKMHMGTVYCNGRFWSPPRGDTEGYINIVSFDGVNIVTYPVEFDQTHILRKYTDFIVRGNLLYALPFGQNGHLDQVLIFDTDTNTYRLQQINSPVFFKKFNCGVLVDNTIIALPYGDKSQSTSNHGLAYNCDTGKSRSFDINESLNFGGKYRFRSGIAFDGHAVFFPTGSPAAPLIVVDKEGNIIHRQYYSDYVLGRPIMYRGRVWTIAYEIETKKQFLFALNGSFVAEFIPIL
jgi:hypothetical protein